MAGRNRNKIRYITVAALAVLLPLGMLSAQSQPPPEAADDDAADHVRAFDALRAGKVVPVTAILDWLDANYHGYVVEVELETAEGPPAYEVEFVTDQGNFIEFTFNAATGAMTGVTGEGAAAARRQP